MRTRPLRGFAAVLLPVLLAGACSSGGSGNTGLAPGAIAAAAAKTTAQKSARVLMVTKIDGPQSFKVEADGRMEIGRARGLINVDMASLGLPGAGGKVEMRIIDTIAYMKIPAALAKEIPAGKKWLKIDYGAISKQKGVDISALQRSFQTGDPAAVLGFLKGAGSVSEAGTETIRGTKTTHYKATVDFAKVAEKAAASERAEVKKLVDLLGAKSMPIEVWLDAEGLLRRMTFSLDLSKLKKKDVTGVLSMKMEMYDFGVNVGDIVAPPAAETVDLQKLIQQQGGSTSQ
jgi:hypothetical protein